MRSAIKHLLDPDSARSSTLKCVHGLSVATPYLIGSGPQLLAYPKMAECVGTMGWYVHEPRADIRIGLSY